MSSGSLTLRNMWNVWRTVLEENEKLARARMAAIEVFQSQIADEAKMLRLHKLQAARKVKYPLSWYEPYLRTFQRGLIEGSTYNCGGGYYRPEIVPWNDRKSFFRNRILDRLVIISRSLH
jgi:hypothetical protein